MIKRITFTLILTLTLLASAQSQNLIGYTKEEVKAYVAENEPNYTLTGDREGVGLIYKVDNEPHQGCIFLIEENDLCYSLQVAFPYNKLNSVINDLNSNYVKLSSYEWLEHSESMIYKLNLIRESSFFIIQRSIHKIK
ncbi:hypothetical protein [Pontibacter fetidus]|uniref:Spi protease inhibitor domain-containing protein n=1 Tax=Pontibacter fetidus TaxID=2700082 RepID=A0A6B2GVF3_9BACT|nr:hypothetical protein [Pontibacter fetidus]NDK54785.1 hypothetical protein [Pontibacter fetidus]